MCEQQQGNSATQEQEIEEIEKRRRKEIKNIQEILDYGKSKYGIQFPARFAEKLYEAAYNRRYPRKKIIDSLMVQWKIWEPYVDKESFQKFMKHELEKMFSIHTTSTFGLSTLNQFIGKKAKLIQQPPETMSTTVYMNGIVKLNGRQVKVPKTV